MFILDQEKQRQKEILNNRFEKWIDQNKLFVVMVRNDKKTLLFNFLIEEIANLQLYNSKIEKEINNLWAERERESNG